MEDIRKQMALSGLIANFKSNTLKEGLARLTAGVLRGRIQLLEKYWDNFQATHTLLQCNEEVQGDEYFRTDVYSTTEFQYTSTLGYLYDTQSRVIPVPEAVHRPGGKDIPPLPKISLPAFSGHLSDWESFRDIFRSMIHLHPSLDNVQKLHYLKTAVQGEAKAAIATIPITDATYSTAWQILLQRYDLKGTLVYQHMSRLVRAPALKEESATGLRSLLDRVTLAQESLRALNQPVDDWDQWMAFFLIEGMDPETRKDWEKTLANEEELSTFSEVSDFITSRIRALKSVTNRKPKTGEATRTQERQARSLASGVSSDGCPNCHGNHNFRKCPSVQVAVPSERRAIAQRCGLCFNCLRPGHTQTQCTLQERCHQCRGTHHTFLHLTTKRKGSTLEDATPGQRPPKEHRGQYATSSTSTTNRRD